MSSLQSEYAIRLYELIIQWKSVGKTNKILLVELRIMLGVAPEQYKKMCNFKAKVLDLAIKQINEYTDITAGYEQHKDGRVITSFTFKFKAKKNKEKTVAKFEKGAVDNGVLYSVEGLSDKQLSRIASNPNFIADYNHLVKSTSPAGQDSSAWEFKMVSRLKKDASQFKKRPIREYLN